MAQGPVRMVGRPVDWGVPLTTLGWGIEIEPRGSMWLPLVNWEACTVTFQPALAPRESVTVNAPMVAVVVRTVPLSVMPAKSLIVGVLTLRLPT